MPELPWQCLHCPEVLADTAAVLEHWRLLHPDNYDDVTRQPDGQPVVELVVSDAG